MKATEIVKGWQWRSYRVEYECHAVRGRTATFATEEEAITFIDTLSSTAVYRLSQIDQTILRKSE